MARSGVAASGLKAVVFFMLSGLQLRGLSHLSSSSGVIMVSGNVARPFLLFTSGSTLSAFWPPAMSGAWL